MEPGKDRDLSMGQFHTVQTPKQPFFSRETDLCSRERSAAILEELQVPP